MTWWARLVALWRLWRSPPPETTTTVIRSLEPSTETVVVIEADPEPTLFDSLPISDLPAHGGAQTPGNRGAAEIDMIVLHTAEGDRPAHWFADSRSGASAHYSVYKSGRIYRSVPDNDVAWHAGNWRVNQRSIGIEISATAALGDWTEVQLLQVAKLVAGIAQEYGIPIDREHIVGHVEVSGPGGHTDPGPHFDWPRFMGLVQGVRGGGVGTVATILTMAPLGIPVWAWGIGLGVLAVSAGAIIGSGPRPPRLL